MDATQLSRLAALKSQRGNKFENNVDYKQTIRDAAQISFDHFWTALKEQVLFMFAETERHSKDNYGQFDFRHPLEIFQWPFDQAHRFILSALIRFRELRTVQQLKVLISLLPPTDKRGLDLVSRCVPCLQ